MEHSKQLRTQILHIDSSVCTAVPSVRSFCRPSEPHILSRIALLSYSRRNPSMFYGCSRAERRNFCTH